MKVEAQVSFCGVVSMTKNEVREIADKAILSDLIKAGYVREVKPSKPTPKKKDVKENEG